MRTSGLEQSSGIRTLGAIDVEAKVKFLSEDEFVIVDENNHAISLDEQDTMIINYYRK